MPNRLADAQSLYLRKHAENPIDWWTWSDAAIETARRENKIIFLSVGYSSCHWCTVMEGEAFSDPEIAAYLNAHYLPIKVDREERPDLDSIYMQALQMMTGQGGWPLNIFLAPDDLVPFYGGTYFPIEEKYGRVGFLQILKTLRRLYDQDRAKIDSVKGEILTNLQNSVLLSPTQTLSSELLKNGLEYSTGILSAQMPGTRFPMIPYADAALRATRFEFNRYDAQEVTTQRGIDLALGGIFDHVAGGFHRYTVDPHWTVPHFEKMLYDNGQIVEYLANLWAAGVQEPAFERAIAKTVEWLKREMLAPESYFYAAQDADSFETPNAAEPEEGAFYVWSYRDLQIFTSDELSELTEQFDITEQGNFEGKIVLQRQHTGTLSLKIETALKKLFAARYGADMDDLFPPARNADDARTIAWSGRIPPVTDTKMIVAWNSLMISGLARSYAVFRELEYLELASQAAEFILQNQWINDRFYRVNYDGKIEVLAQSEDFALFIKALLDLHQVTRSIGSIAPENQTDWLSHAVRLQAEFDQYLWSVELGGYYNTAKDASQELLVRERSYLDNATPSANGVAIANLIRLFLLTEDFDYFDRAEQTLQAFGSVMEQTPSACPSLFVALDWFRNQTLIRTSIDQIAQLETQYLPTVAFKIAQLPEGSIALVCQGLSCKEPAQNQEQLQTQLQQSLVRSV